MSEILESEAVKQALAHAERGLARIHTLDIGPLDANVAMAVDELVVAAALLEMFHKDQAR